MFATPNSRIKWGRGDVARRSLTKNINLQNPQAISSYQLRKQIATVMQIFNLSRDEVKQFSDFMGHTQNMHGEFYELPVDIYETAKVSKILSMMEKDNLSCEIHFDHDLELAIENDGADDVVESETNSAIQDVLIDEQHALRRKRVHHC